MQIASTTVTCTCGKHGQCNNDMATACMRPMRSMLQTGSSNRLGSHMVLSQGTPVSALVPKKQGSQASTPHPAGCTHHFSAALTSREPEALTPGGITAMQCTVLSGAQGAGNRTARDSSRLGMHLGARSVGVAGGLRTF